MKSKNSIRPLESPLADLFKKTFKEHIKPFSVEMSNKISSGDVTGLVCTRIGTDVRIICTDAKGDFPIIGLVDYGDNERPKRYRKNGGHRDDAETEDDLIILVGEHEKLTELCDKMIKSIYEDND